MLGLIKPAHKKSKRRAPSKVGIKTNTSFKVGCDFERSAKMGWFHQAQHRCQTRLIDWHSSLQSLFPKHGGTGKIIECASTLTIVVCNGYLTIRPSRESE
jgi:hypothetical protein